MIELIAEHKYFIENAILNLKPWEILQGDRFQSKYDGIKERFPKNSLVPFAVRTDCDDVACFNIDSLNKEVIIIHDYSSVGWERREIFSSFWDWLNRAIEDLVDFAKEDIEYDLASPH